MSNLIANWHCLYWKDRAGKSDSRWWHNMFDKTDAATCEWLAKTDDHTPFYTVVHLIRQISPGASCLTWFNQKTLDDTLSESQSEPEQKKKYPYRESNPGLSGESGEFYH